MGYDFFGVFDYSSISYNQSGILYKAIRYGCKTKNIKENCGGIRALYGLKGKKLQSEIDKATKKIEKMKGFSYIPTHIFRDGCHSEDYLDKDNAWLPYRDLKGIKETSEQNPDEIFQGD